MYDSANEKKDDLTQSITDDAVEDIDDSQIEISEEELKSIENELTELVTNFMQKVTEYVATDYEEEDKKAEILEAIITYAEDLSEDFEIGEGTEEIDVYISTILSIVGIDIEGLDEDVVGNMVYDLLDDLVHIISTRGDISELEAKMEVIEVILNILPAEDVALDVFEAAIKDIANIYADDKIQDTITIVDLIHSLIETSINNLFDKDDSELVDVVGYKYLAAISDIINQDEINHERLHQLLLNIAGKAPELSPIQVVEDGLDEVETVVVDLNLEQLTLDKADEYFIRCALAYKRATIDAMKIEIFEEFMDGVETIFNNVSSELGDLPDDVSTKSKYMQTLIKLYDAFSYERVSGIDPLSAKLLFIIADNGDVSSLEQEIDALEEDIISEYIASEEEGAVDEKAASYAQIDARIDEIATQYKAADQNDKDGLLDALSSMSDEILEVTDEDQSKSKYCRILRKIFDADNDEEFDKKILGRFLIYGIDDASGFVKYQECLDDIIDDININLSFDQIENEIVRLAEIYNQNIFKEEEDKNILRSKLLEYAVLAYESGNQEVSFDKFDYLSKLVMLVEFYLKLNKIEENIYDIYKLVDILLIDLTGGKGTSRFIETFTDIVYKNSIRVLEEDMKKEVSLDTIDNEIFALAKVYSSPITKEKKENTFIVINRTIKRLEEFEDKFADEDGIIPDDVLSQIRYTPMFIDVINLPNDRLSIEENKKLLIRLMDNLFISIVNNTEPTLYIQHLESLEEMEEED